MFLAEFESIALFAYVCFCLHEGYQIVVCVCACECVYMCLCLCVNISKFVCARRCSCACPFHYSILTNIPQQETRFAEVDAAECI